MIKDGFNLKRTRTAAKRPPAFRLSEEVVFSASGKHTDPYRCVLTGRRIRDRFVVSLVMTHEPSQSIVHSDSWLFESMETCWDKFHTIKGIVLDIRDFLEAEGIRNVVAQYMVRHALTSVSADVENMYETAIPYIRPVIDTATKGNILKNMPLIPFREQSGPDRLHEVFKSTGTAPNPVPDDGIRPPFYYKHVRNDRGMKDVVSRPLSGFQAAAQDAGVPISRTASGSKPVKTAVRYDVVSEFLAKVRDGAKRAVQKGRKDAIEHYISATGSMEDEADRFYDAVKSLSEKQKVVLEMPTEELVKLLAEGIYVPMDEDDGAYNARREREMMSALSLGVRPIRASLRSKPSASPGVLSVVLADPGDAVFFNGHLDRVRNPSRADYVEEADTCLYPTEYAADCRAASIIPAMSVSELAAGPFRAIEEIAKSNKEFGRVEALILDSVTPDRISEIVAANPEEATKLRKLMDKLGKILPISSVSDITVVDPFTDRSEPEGPAEVGPVEQLHFKISDRVAMKPRLNNPSIKGTVSDVSNAQVTVQWDNGGRHVYDAAEALMRLMTLPGDAPPVEGMVVYQLPGMDEKSVNVLNSLGIDPVTVHSLASHAMPASDSVGGWEDVLTNSFARLGIPISKTSGFVYQEGPEAFSKGEWFEGRLPERGRLVIDMGPSKLVIRAGDVDDYLVPSRRLIFE